MGQRQERKTQTVPIVVAVHASKGLIGGPHMQTGEENKEKMPQMTILQRSQGAKDADTNEGQ